MTIAFASVLVGTIAGVGSARPPAGAGHGHAAAQAHGPPPWAGAGGHGHGHGAGGGNAGHGHGNGGGDVAHGHGNGHGAGGGNAGHGHGGPAPGAPVAPSGASHGNHGNGGHPGHGCGHACVAATRPTPVAGIPAPVLTTPVTVGPTRPPRTTPSRASTPIPSLTGVPALQGVVRVGARTRRAHRGRRGARAGGRGAGVLRAGGRGPSAAGRRGPGAGAASTISASAGLPPPFGPQLTPTLPAAATQRGRTLGQIGLRRQSTPNVIERIERVIPEGVWLALAGALLLALVAGAAALWSGARARRQAGRVAALREVALTDPLTGLLNRRGFISAAERELARARRYGRPFTLAYVDVRGLKRVNDSEGHLAGDALLREAATLLRENARADDAVGRLGGDELAMLLVEQDEPGATAVRKRITDEVQIRRPQLGLDAPWDLTVGTATFPRDGETVRELLHAADQRLYKERGIELR